MQRTYLTFLRFLFGLLFTFITTTVSSSQPILAQGPLAWDRWQRLDTTGGGGQTAIATHPTNPDIVYMASDNGGLFKTENGGDSWVSGSSNLGAYRLGFVILDPLNPDVIYVAASTGYGSATSGGATGEIHRSMNGGLFWEFVSDAMGFQNSFPNQRSIVIPYDPADPGRFDGDGDSLSDVIVVGAWTGPADPPVGGIWRSEDEGGKFIHLALQDRNITALRAFPGDVNVLFATTYEGEVYRSEDMGEHWLDITGNMPLSRLSDVAVHPTDKDVLYVTCRWCQAGVSPIWKTEDGGQSWQSNSAGLDTNEIGGFPNLLIDRFDPETLYVTTWEALYGKGGVYQSTDGGSSWHLMPARLVLPDGRPYFWYTFDDGLAIEQAIDGRLFAVDTRAGWRYPDGDLTDGREEWEPATIGIGNIYVNTVEVDPFDSTVLYQGIGDFGPYKSVDRGLSFYRILGNGWPVTVENYFWNGPYYNNYEYCRLSCSSTCTGSGQMGGAGGTTDFAISRQNSNIVYSAFGSKHGGVNKSTDGGRTWQPVGFQLENGFELNPDTCVPYRFRHLAIDPTNDDIVFAVQEIPTTETGKLYKTRDGGATWAEVYVTGYIKGLAVSAVNPEVVVFTTFSGVYKSEQGGEPGSWQEITPPGASGFSKVRLSSHQAQVYVVGSNDRGLFYTDDGGMSWQQNLLKDLVEQKLYQGSNEYLDSEIATAFNPEVYVLKNISAIVFDPVRPDTFYVAGTQHVRASFGVAKITNAGQNWERLPLSGLSHRNVFDLAIDSVGEYLYAGTFDGTYQFRLGEPGVPPNDPPTPTPTNTPTPEPNNTPSPEPTPDPITLNLNAPPAVNSGETFNVDVKVQGISTPGLYGIQLEINYDPSLISVNNLQPNPNLSFVVLNSADNTNGKIKLVASQQGKVPGLTGDVTLLSFDATAANTSGTVTFTFENEKMSDSQAQGFDIVSEDYTVSIGETVTPEPTNDPTPVPTNTPPPIPTSTPTSEPTDEPMPSPTPTATPVPPTPTLTPTPLPTDTPEPTPTCEPPFCSPVPLPTDTPTPIPTDEPAMADVSGQVILAGRAGNDWSGATVTIDDSGQIGATEAMGNFSIVDVATGSLSSITTDAPGYLSAVCTGPAVTAPETVLDAISLLSGDINDNNQVDITDATAVGASFGQTGTDLPADITQDSIVDIFDIVLVSVNFGEEGPQTWNCLNK